MRNLPRLLTVLIASALLLTAAPSPTSALPLAARDGADLPAKGTMRVGIFSPLTWVVLPNLELETHPLVTLLAPHLTARYRKGTLGPARLTWEGGLSLPTPGLHLAPPGLAGYIMPSCLVAAAEPERGSACEQGDHVLVVRGGMLASFGEGDVTTVRLDGAYGVLLGSLRPRADDAWAPLSVLLAPVTRGSRLHAMVRRDHGLHERVRVAAELHLWRLARVDEDPDDRSTLVFGAHLGVDVGIGSSTRLQLGALYTNIDNRASEEEPIEGGFVKRVFVRSQNVWPTVDVVWSF